MIDQNRPLLSIIILTYNHESYISDALRSVVGLEYPNKEICVLDDGSTDGTLEVAKAALATASCPVRLVSQPNSGGQISKNSQKLVRMANGEYILSMSGDDMLTYSFSIESLIDRMENDPSLAMAIPRALLVQQSDASQRLEAIYSNGLAELLRSSSASKVLEGHLYKMVSRLFVQGTVLRRSFIDQFGGFDESLVADDYAFFMRAFKAMQQNGQRFHFDEDSMWIYRRHGNNVHSDIPRQRQLVYEVVAKYVPPEHWPEFRFDHSPSALDDVARFCDQLRTHFGAQADELLIPRHVVPYLKNELAAPSLNLEARKTIYRLITESLGQNHWQAFDWQRKTPPTLKEFLQLNALKRGMRNRDFIKVASVLVRSSPGVYGAFYNWVSRRICRSFSP